MGSKVRLVTSGDDVRQMGRGVTFRVQFRIIQEERPPWTYAPAGIPTVTCTAGCFQPGGASSLEDDDRRSGYLTFPDSGFCPGSDLPRLRFWLDNGDGPTSMVASDDSALFGGD